jgi:ankyrin repeat protein
MPVRRLQSNPNLDHLRYQARDLLKDHAARSPEIAQLIREFHPRFARALDADIFNATLSLNDAQLTIAREHGFLSWARLKRHIEKPTLSDQLHLPHHKRIEDPTFRRAVDLLDAGDTAGLQTLLNFHPKLVHQHVLFEGGNYFRSPTLLEFVAENPVRHGRLPVNIVEVARIILEAGADRAARNKTLMLVATGSVPREREVQLALIDLLCEHGADPDSAIQAAAVLDEHDSVNALIRHGAKVKLPVAAALGRMTEFSRLLDTSSPEERHLALSLAARFGHVEIVRLLLDAGEDPDRYNPLGGHSHATPLHQAAGVGHKAVVSLLVERGARLDLKDVLWHATPAEWAAHEGKTELEEYLRAKERALPFGRNSRDDHQG